jgi:hypothetical protein
MHRLGSVAMVTRKHQLLPGTRQTLRCLVSRYYTRRSRKSKFLRGSILGRNLQHEATLLEKHESTKLVCPSLIDSRVLKNATILEAAERPR